ncbi:hypothetical protein M0813_28616 [Anaeramoeba flamelloides]|uniref:PAS domain-containing protein n=1 Tax=Anaeramoeba flamelloides TaxID=1746091 RepID=A0ABQ8XSS4_9EUKA|nr:hypothetical protein M0813_28616 [Anaeramoeba flamelloides]
MGNQTITIKNSHHIKKRHKKRYFKKLETVNLHVAVFDITSSKMVYANKTALKDFGLKKFPEKGGIGPELLTQPYQKFFKCSAEEAIQKLKDKVANSKDGTFQNRWDYKTIQGEPFSVWITNTIIIIGNEVNLQAIAQKIDDEEDEPESINQSIVKVKISDGSSELTTNMEMSETTDIQDNKELQKNSTSFGDRTSLEEFIKEDVSENIIDEIKKKIRSYDDYETETFITNQLNLLNSKIEEQKNYYQQKISELLQSSSKQKTDQKQKYLELETLYGKRLESFKKEKSTNKELKEEVKKLKKRIYRIKKQLQDL